MFKSSEDPPPNKVEDDEEENLKPACSEVRMPMGQEATYQERSSDDIETRMSSREMFKDCALVEIIHLHDCLRGALRALEKDVTELARTAAIGADDLARDQLSLLERKVASRFKVIWSVFRAHSAAEDEFIWPALKKKINLPSLSSTKGVSVGSSSDTRLSGNDGADVAIAGEAAAEPAKDAGVGEGDGNSDHLEIEPQEYVEDHADEEKMFLMMDELLSKLRAGLALYKSLPSMKTQEIAAALANEAVTSSVSTLVQRSRSPVERDTDLASSETMHVVAAMDSAEKCTESEVAQQSDASVDNFRCASVLEMAVAIQKMATSLSKHLMQHLEKEEVQCMPLVTKHLNKQEINDLVGKIMGKRSSDTICQILTMAIQTLPEAEREEMLLYMKQAMVGTFFERWLAMEGFWKLPTAAASPSPGNREVAKKKTYLTESSSNNDQSNSVSLLTALPADISERNKATNCPCYCLAAGKKSCLVCMNPNDCMLKEGCILSQNDLERVIRSIASNPELSAQQKATAIQSVRDSLWKSSQKRKLLEIENVEDTGPRKMGTKM